MAGSSVLLISDTFSGQKLSDNYFQTKPTDLSYSLTEYMKFTPSSSVNASESFEFFLPASSGPSCYFPGDLLLSIQLKITKKDGTAPDDAAEVGRKKNLCLNQCQSFYIIFQKVRSTISFTLFSSQFAFPLTELP